MAQSLTLEDLRLARTPEALLALFRKLGYRVEPEMVPLDPDELEFPPARVSAACFCWPTTTGSSFSCLSWKRCRWPTCACWPAPCCCGPTIT